MRPGIIVLVVTLAASILIIAGTERARAYQHVNNGGFETGLNGWSPAPGVAITVTSDAPAEGSAAAKVTVGASPSRIDYAVTGVLAAGSYDASVSIRGASGANVRLSFTPGTQPRADIASGAVSASWSEVSGQVVLSGAYAVTLSIVVEGTPGSEVYLDDLRLEGAGPVTFTPTATRTSTPVPAAQGTPGTPALAIPLASTTSAPAATVAAAVDVISDSLRNPGFEDVDAAGLPFAWEKFGGVLASDGRARGGSRAARLDSSTSSTKWLHQAVTVRGGEWYAFEGWVEHDHPGVAAAYLRISWYASSDGSGSALRTDDSLDLLDTRAPGYRHLTTGDALAPADARSARVRVMMTPRSDAPASILVDDVSFGASSPPPSTPTPTASPSPSLSAATTDAEAPHGGTSVGRTTPRGARGIAPAGIPLPDSTAQVVINEILYDADSDVPDPEAEWVEIYNAGDAPIDLAGWSLRDGTSTRTLPQLVVAARGFAIVAATDAFHAAYPGVTAPIVILGGRIGNGLGNDGDALALVDPAGAIVDAVSWGDDVSAFAPAVEDVPAGHSIERELVGVDSNSARDFIDNERPSPGLEFSPAMDPKQQNAGRSVTIIEGAGEGNFGWVPWALAAVSIAACGATLGWRTFEHVRSARHP
jgi:hypothetical protein